MNDESLKGIPLMAYSSLLSTIHDEKHPIGNIGRGSHYSVFICAQWLNENLEPDYKYHANTQRFSVIWDEDHDERIIPVIEHAYMIGLFAPVKFIGERKGILTIIVSDNFWSRCDQKDYQKRWNEIASSKISDDSWIVEISPESAMASSCIVYPTGSFAETYLKNIENLWGLGLSGSPTAYCLPKQHRDPLV